MNSDALFGRGPVYVDTRPLADLIDPAKNLALDYITGRDRY
jgi:hypothetical protein